MLGMSLDLPYTNFSRRGEVMLPELKVEKVVEVRILAVLHCVRRMEESLM
jgi:hypothetical protein